MKFTLRITVAIIGLLALLLVGACGTSSDDGKATVTGAQPGAGGGQAAQTGVQQGTAEPTSTPRAALKPPGPTIPLSEWKIASADAAVHIGEETEVCGFVAEVKYEKELEGRPTFLRFDGIAPDHPFQVMIPGKRRTRWPNPPELYYASSQTCAKGLLEEFDGIPTIIIEQQYLLTIPGGGGYRTLPSRQQQQMEREAREAERTKEAQK